MIDPSESARRHMKRINARMEGSATYHAISLQISGVMDEITRDDDTAHDNISQLILAMDDWSETLKDFLAHRRVAGKDRRT